MTDNLESYERKKARVMAEFKAALETGASIGLGKKTSNLFRSRQQAKRLIDVTDLNAVISIDTERLLAEVEGMTTFDDFTKETLKHGLLPAVVPELKSITIGGAMAGGAIESSSFRHGLVHETVSEMDVLTGAGDVIHCSRTNQHKDLFFGFPNTYGTLGYALKLTVKLVRAKPYVELRHRKFSDAGRFFSAVQEACSGDAFDFVDGTVFDAGTMYLTTARFVDAAPFLSDYTYMQIFYRSIAEKEIDYLKAYDYIWRWDTDWFWCSANFGVQKPAVRLLVRPWLHSTAYWKIMGWNRKYHFSEKLQSLRGIGRQEESVIQDVQIPVERAPEFLAFFQEKIGITPVWICPTSPASPEVYPTYRLTFGQLYVNFGFWDVVPLPPGEKDGYFNRQVEQWVDKTNGRKSLYSTAFYDRDTFWRHYDGEYYHALKKKYDPRGNLKDLYDKSVRAARTD
ncbi:FAD-binding oxidoreductase [Geomonas sp.]|uniref:FAD-binding oxidoreductase n=1 Tax=Geomonas sp. TaxID=2651584 RepID=UPI002B4A4895|nr:FAD-binding oxidoreductase [Geomonas sp.]HJV34983.1 FAD-binding oxidoreductase [Geomonas sp.]